MQNLVNIFLHIHTSFGFQLVVSWCEPSEMGFWTEKTEVIAHIKASFNVMSLP